MNRPDIKSKDELQNELEVEWVNMALYASDAIIIKMKKFIDKKDRISFNELIVEMRKDLFGMKSKLTPNDFEI